MKCLNCGNENPHGSKFCQGCGRLLEEKASIQPDESNKDNDSKNGVQLSQSIENSQTVI